MAKFTWGLGVGVWLMASLAVGSGGNPEDCSRLGDLSPSQNTASSPPQASSQRNELLPEFNPKQWADQNAELKIPQMRAALLRENYVWLDAVMGKLVNQPATGTQKVALFETFLNESERRVEAVQKTLRQKGGIWSIAKLNRWQCRRADLGGGITVFWGDAGQILEFHPNGEVYRARVGPIAVKGIYSAEWKPPYNQDGTPIPPPGGIEAESRRKLLPNSAPRPNASLPPPLEQLEW